MSELIKKYSETKIGVFDSGVGGLSILKVLKKNMPLDSFIYFGDTKHIPYGSKTKEEIIDFGRNTISFFQSKGVKNIVIACNTSSALAYEILREEFCNVNIFPLIQSVAPSIARYNKVAIWATVGTVKSSKYKTEILKYNKDAQVIEIACPDFVKIVENNLYEDEKYLELIRRTYTETMCLNPNKIILGCTHYPYLMKVLGKFANKNIFIDPSDIFVSVVKNSLELNNYALSTPTTEFFVSDNPEKFRQNAKMFYEINEDVKLIS